MVIPEQSPEVYEYEHEPDSEIEDDNPYPAGSVVPAVDPPYPDIIWPNEQHLEVCQVCGSPNWHRYQGHWVCAEDFVEYKTNIQF